LLVMISYKHCKYISIYQNIIGTENFVLAPFFDKDFC
jgi:hypothetical protein